MTWLLIALAVGLFLAGAICGALAISLCVITKGEIDIIDTAPERDAN